MLGCPLGVFGVQCFAQRHFSWVSNHHYASASSLVSHRNTLRVTRSAALSSQDGSVGGSVYLGKKGKDFEFSQLPMKVEFLECSARGCKGEDGVADVDGLEKSLARL